MGLDYAKLKAMPPIVTETKWGVRDTILYALGAGSRELDFVYEQGLKPLPTEVCVLTYPGFIWQKPEMGLDWKRILHAEQSIELHHPLKPAGRYTGHTTIDALVDKGANRGAMLYSSRRIYDEDGLHVATACAATMARGDGGFAEAGDDPPWHVIDMPDRAADDALTLATTEDQALIYRLSGDMNPLHIDPEVAASAGFDRPILHGMCTFAVAGRGLLRLLTQGDATRLRAMRCRFTAPVYPGESLRIEVWHQAAGKALFRATAIERDLVVLNNGLAEFITEREAQ